MRSCAQEMLEAHISHLSLLQWELTQRWQSQWTKKGQRCVRDLSCRGPREAPHQALTLIIASSSALFTRSSPSRKPAHWDL